MRCRRAAVAARPGACFGYASITRSSCTRLPHSATAFPARPHAHPAAGLGWAGDLGTNLPPRGAISYQDLAVPGPTPAAVPSAHLDRHHYADVAASERLRPHHFGVTVSIKPKRRTVSHNEGAGSRHEGGEEVSDENGHPRGDFVPRSRRSSPRRRRQCRQPTLIDTTTPRWRHQTTPTTPLRRSGVDQAERADRFPQRGSRIPA